MSSSNTIKLFVGDTLPQLNFTLNTTNSAASCKPLHPDAITTLAPVALSCATVQFIIS